MGYYETPEAMYRAREEQFRKSGDQYWARAKAGKGDAYYERARFCYGQAAENYRRAERARKENKMW